MKEALARQSRYALGHSEQELDRLSRQAEIFEPFTRQLTTEFQCPLLGVKQTSSPTAVVMSALCQKQTLCSAATDRDLSQHVRSNFRQ